MYFQGNLVLNIPNKEIIPKKDNYLKYIFNVSNYNTKTNKKFIQIHHQQYLRLEKEQDWLLILLYKYQNDDIFNNEDSLSTLYIGMMLSFPKCCSYWINHKSKLYKIHKKYNIFNDYYDEIPTINNDLYYYINRTYSLQHLINEYSNIPIVKIVSCLKNENDIIYKTMYDKNFKIDSLMKLSLNSIKTKKWFDIL